MNPDIQKVVDRLVFSVKEQFKLENPYDYSKIIKQLEEYYKKEKLK